MSLPNQTDLRALLQRTLHPRTKLGKVTLWIGALALLLQVLRGILRPGPGSLLGGWASFLTYVFVCFALVMGLRWVRRRLMWRLRNRLIVTYVFIGVIPLILLVAMALVAGFLFAGQFATYVAMSDLQSELQHLEATNRSMAWQFRSLARQSKLTPDLAREIVNASDENFRHRSVTVWDGAQSFMLAEPSRAAQGPIKTSPAFKNEFAGFVLDNDQLQLRVVKRLVEGEHHITVISNMPITSELLRKSTSELGSVTLSADIPAMAAKAAANSGQSSVVYEAKMPASQKEEPGTVQAGSVPPPTNFFDFHIPFGTRFDLIEWPSGKSLNGLVLVDTRPSMLYATLFSALGDKAGIFRDLLIGIAIFFGVIELIALFIGVRLTRSMTKSVSELYKATEHINRGELTHRIQVRSHDQMAALEQSFNSMTQSLSNLIAEQKEKQRMQSELAIAHEVQALLFPADLSGLPSLEVHGVCRPARTVSGDYYDFIPLGDHRMMLALGDISGKGISAALLMATVHAFVRAYSFEPEKTLASLMLGGGTTDTTVLTIEGNGNGGSELSPGFLMSTLNYQLYRSTPPEKYATMFLAHYDALSRSLTYSNAGHLPPMLLSGDGNVRRLETSGTVVGLFDGMTYGESTEGMHSGDIFIAFSDGITEPENEFGEFGEERLIELVRQNRNESLARISDVVTGAVADWIAGGEQPDDVTLVLARAR